MKARLPKEYNSGSNNLQQIAKQAQKLQDDMKKVTEQLETKEYKSTADGGNVEATVTGKFEVKELKIKKAIIDPDDTEMLTDLVIVAVNEALNLAKNEKEEVIEKMSGGLDVSGIF
ncbi:MAG: YbaB/EbfC family nucleoid-associated protein [Oscillospiraceae bacterium]|jgi:DNA-binding YbaB/EbfC family protein|nr:YbaB/EbfC family nucleoid-associated protein [Oscillospiraceae bacterium]